MSRRVRWVVGGCIVGLAVAVIVVVSLDTDEGPPDGPPADVVREAELLRAFLAEDPVLLPLEEVEDVVARGLPVRAAEMLRQGAIPAARRAVTEIAAEQYQTPEIRRLQDDAEAAYQARLVALEQYADVLEQGGQESLELVEALRAQRLAEESLAAVIDSLEALSSSPENSQS